MNVQLLKTVALISTGKLSHLTYRWKGGTSFTLEQIASILYRIERNRAKTAARIARDFGIALCTLLVAACLYIGWRYARPYGIEVALFVSFWNLGTSANLARFGVRYARRLTYRYFMTQDVPASYAVELKKFSDALHEALKYLHINLQNVLLVHRDEIAAIAAELLDSKAMEVVRLERDLSDYGTNDELYDGVEARLSKRREEFRHAYAALAALNLAGGGYTNFFRRAAKALEESVAA